jgi:hypothetical protein
MNKRTITLLVITGIIALALIVGGMLLQYYASFHKVTITVKKAEITADVYQPEPGVSPEDGTPTDKKIATVKGAQVITLQAGDYYIKPQGDKYDSKAIAFTVKDKDLSVTVDPGFSSTYLSSLLQQELSTIKSVILARYPFISTGYKLNDGKLYEDGTWYGTTLVQNAEAGNNGDVYRMVLHKVNGTWQFAATPSIIISIPEHADIPADLLKDLNAQSGY